MEIRTYQMKFACLNCDHEFTQDIEKGKEVEDRLSSGARILGYPCEPIKCPKCECNTARKAFNIGGRNDRK